MRQIQTGCCIKTVVLKVACAAEKSVQDSRIHVGILVTPPMSFSLVTCLQTANLHRVPLYKPTVCAERKYNNISVKNLFWTSSNRNNTMKKFV